MQQNGISFRVSDEAFQGVPARIINDGKILRVLFSSCFLHYAFWNRNYSLFSLSAAHPKRAPKLYNLRNNYFDTHIKIFFFWIFSSPPADGTNTQSSHNIESRHPPCHSWVVMYSTVSKFISLFYLFGLMASFRGAADPADQQEAVIDCSSSVRSCWGITTEAAIILSLLCGRTAGLRNENKVEKRHRWIVRRIRYGLCQL